MKIKRGAINDFYYFSGKYSARQFIGFNDEIKIEIVYDYYNNNFKHMEDTGKKIKFVEVCRSCDV